MPNPSSGNESTGPSLLHQAFLERASDTSATGSGDLALGAFLTLRMVDQFGSAASPNPDALSYQVRATWDFVQNLPGESPELSSLRQIARVGEQVLKKNEPRFLWSPMLAYAYWLEGELRLAETLDVLDTVLSLEVGTESGERIAALLQRARVLRHASRYDEATQSYLAGGAMARQLGDDHSERRSKIGCAIIMQKRGNLPAADAALRALRLDAQRAGDRHAEATACHDIANGLELMGRGNEGVTFAYQAYELYEQRVDQVKALSDVGLLMKTLGNYAAADDALMVVLASEPTALVRLNTVLELLELAARTKDRVAFERWRRELEQQRANMPPDAYVDFETKLGQGYAAFGQVMRAREALESAVRRAEQHRLSKYLFRAEEALRALTDAPQHQREDAHQVTGSHLPEVDEVVEKLQLLRASA